MSVACREAGAQPPVGGAGDGTAGGFIATETGWRYAGDLTFANAAAVMQASSALPLPAGGTVDIGELRHADSAALAVLIALRRRAASEGVALAVVGVPQALRSLAAVYGVDELIA